MRELLEIRAPDEVHGRDLTRAHDVLCKRLIEATAADKHGNVVCAIETVGERCEMLHRPALVRPVRANGKGDKFASRLHPLACEQRFRRRCVTFGNGDGEAHLVHRTAECPCDIEIALDNMPLGVRSTHGAAHEIRTLAHIRRTDAQLCPRIPCNRRRLKEPLQIERGIIAAPAQTSAKRPDLTQKAADTAELCLLKQNELVDVGIVFENRIRSLLDNPRQMRLRKLLLDGIRNGQGMNHVANRTQLDDDDILHALPSFHYFRPARSMIPVVDLPATSGINATSPP